MSLNDPQINLAKVLKPYRNFEADYQGQSAGLPIAFFAPDADGVRNPRDPSAGKPGFDDNLLNYFDVPLGARVLLWIPACISASGDAIVQHDYVYGIQWRLRNTTDYRNNRTPFHLARQFPGQANTLDLTSPQRLVIPAASRTIIVHQAEPTGDDTQQNHLRRESIEFMSTFATGNYSQLPLLPGGAVGLHQQGVLNPANFPLFPNVPGGSIFMPFWFDAEGDQMLVTAMKPTITGELNWDFAGVDAPFSNIYGINSGGVTHEDFTDIGIYVMTGIA